MSAARAQRHGLALVASAVALATYAPLAAADAVYHTEHLSLTPVGGAPLQDGFVQNIKAEGLQIYAREVFVLNGATPDTTYVVTRNLFFFDPPSDLPSPTDPGCTGSGFSSPVGEIATNAAGNGRDDAVVRPEEIPGFLVGDHGVFWTVADLSGSIRYRTACTKVTLD